MKITRNFSVTASKGRMVYTTGPTVPVPVKVRAMTLFLKDGQAGEEKDFKVTHDGTPILSGRGKPGERLVLDTPLRLSAGKQTFRMTSGPFKDGELVEGSVEIEVSFF